MKARTFALLAVAMLFSSQMIDGQTTRRVTIMTVKGDTVEGVLRSVSVTEAVVEVAGQTLRLPLDNIKYISFTGKLETGLQSVAATTASPRDKAISALKILRAATDIGMLRPQYNEKLVETLPTVVEFLRSQGQDSMDVRLAMMKAVTEYQTPLASLDAWRYAGGAVTRARRYGDYATALAVTPGEDTHSEKPTDYQIEVGGVTTGRLGSGDRNMPSTLDASTDNGFHDRYELRITNLGRVTIKMLCDPCTPRITVSSTPDSAIASDTGHAPPDGLSRAAEVTLNPSPGTYYIWAGTRQGDLGTYHLSVATPR